MFCTVMAAHKGLPYTGFEQKGSPASHCQVQLPLFFTFCYVNRQCQLCVEPPWYEEQPGSSISATYLFKNKLRALNTLLNSDEYNITRERVFYFMSKNLAWTQQQVDSI